MLTPVPLSPASRSQDDRDPLLYLPCSTILKYSRSEPIYGADHPCSHLYVIIDGVVQIARPTPEGKQMVVDLYRTDDFFGENALVSAGRRGEEAVALENTMLMSWTIEEVEQLMERRPLLGISLLRLMAEREKDLGERIQTFVVDNVPVRLAKALIRFTQRMGTLGPDGRFTMRGFRHDFLARYIGTSREVVTASLTDLRRQQIIEYERRETTVNVAALQDWIRRNQ